jgi:type II secretory pathway component PulF
VLFAAARHLAWIWGALAVAGGLAIGLGALLGRFPAGRRLKEAALLRIPVLGRIYQGGVVSRLADAMALLVGAGCDMPTCLRLAASATGSETAVRQCQVLAERVEKGESFAEPGAVGPMLPGMFLYSMQLGSRRNELQDNLYGLSEMYAAQARLGQAALQSLLLPLMLILVGVFVGVGVAAIFLPVWQMVKSMGGM